MNTQVLTIQRPRERSLTAIPDAWLAGQLAESSIRVYRHDIGAYCDYCQMYDLDPLHPASLSNWRDYLVQETRKSPNTINRMLGAVRRFVKEGSLPSRGLFTPELATLFSDVPGCRPVSLKDRLRKGTRTRIESRDMRGIASEPDRSTLPGKRDAALLATFASSGIRNSELAALQIGDINEHDGGYFVVIRGGGKHQFIDREAWLSEEAYRLIKEWLEARSRVVVSDYIFTGFETRHLRARSEPLTPRSILRIVKQYAGEYAEESGKEELKDITVHSLRRFVGTQVYEREGIEAAVEALGHSNPATTLKHYVLRKRRGGLTNHLY